MMHYWDSFAIELMAIVTLNQSRIHRLVVNEGPSTDLVFKRLCVSEQVT